MASPRDTGNGPGRAGQPRPTGKIMSGVEIDFRPATPEFNRDPFPIFAELREKDPVYWWEQGGAWILTRYEDVVRALDDPRISRDSRIARRNQEARAKGRKRRLAETFFESSLTRVEGQDHKRLRGLVSKAFTPRAIARVEPMVQQVTDQLLAAFPSRGEVDLVPSFTNLLPTMVISRLLGVGRENESDFKQLADRMIRVTNPLISEEERDDVDAAIAELAEKLSRLLEEKRQNPADDIVSGLLAARDEGDRLSENEMLATVMIITLGGTETTVNAIGQGVVALATRPQLVDRLLGEPELWPHFVDELMRYQGGSKMRPYVVAEDMELRGKKLRRGDLLFASMISAHRDPRVFPDPDTFDIDRDTSRAVAFGRGRHFCLGANLARAEIRISLRTLFGRYPHLRLATEDLHYEPHLLLRVLESLPVRLGEHSAEGNRS